MYSMALSITAPAWDRWAWGSVLLLMILISFRKLLSASWSRNRFQLLLDGLQGPHPRIESPLRQQAGMGAAFGDRALLQDDDLIRVHHGGEPVRNHQRRAPQRHRPQRHLDILLRAR